MRTTTTATKRIRSKFEAEDGGTTKLPAENSDAFIHTTNSFFRIPYASAVAAASVAARIRKLQKRSREETLHEHEQGRQRRREKEKEIGERRREGGGEKERERERERERKREMTHVWRNQILSFRGEDFQVKISRGTKSKLVFVRYSSAPSSSLSSSSSSTLSST